MLGDIYENLVCYFQTNLWVSQSGWLQLHVPVCAQSINSYNICVSKIHNARIPFFGVQEISNNRCLLIWVDVIVLCLKKFIARTAVKIWLLLKFIVLTIRTNPHILYIPTPMPNMLKFSWCGMNLFLKS